MTLVLFFHFHKISHRNFTLMELDMTRSNLSLGSFTGFNRFSDFMYSSSSTRPFLSNKSMNKHLLDAICHDEFELVYQPQTDIFGHNVVGVEALVRWNSSALGMVSPSIFIPLAEKSGLISDIGKLVIDKACAQAAIWKRRYSSNLRIAVNVSYIQVHDKSIVQFIESCLNKYELDIDALEIELTESSLITDTSKVIRVVNELKDIGIRTAIDDFGTGYSSLSYLASMPFSLIKIDRSFISLLGENMATTAITQSIIELSKKLEMEVLAEGVETLKQKSILIQSECGFMQGNLFSCPVTAEKIPHIAGLKKC